MGVTLYGLGSCDSCRKARNWLGRAGIEHQFIDYREQRIDAATLTSWAQQLGGWSALVNRASTTWRTLPEARRTPGSDPEWTLLIREHPALVKRPVLVDAAGVCVGFAPKAYAQRFGK